MKIQDLVNQENAALYAATIDKYVFAKVLIETAGLVANDKNIEELENSLETYKQ